MTDNSENLLAEELLEETPYRIEDGKFCYLRPSRNGSHEVIPLCNFVAQCGEEISLDDGRGAAKYFLVSGKLDNGQPLPPVRIKASEFPSMNWVTRDWGIGANLAAGQGTRDKVREAIQTISQDAKQRTVFTHTGWRKINGVWVFLHAGGALGGSSGVEVDLGSELSRYSLPEPGALEAARASMRLLEVAPWEITAPLIACAYLAPLTTQLQVDFTLWLLGPT